MKKRVKKKLLSIVYILGYYLGVDVLFYWLNRDKQRVLVYHNIIPDELWMDALFLVTGIRESVFRKQIALISKRLRLSTILDEPCSAMFTFDDGYRCANITSRILEDYATAGLFFMPVENIGSKQPLWIDKIMLWFSLVPENRYEIGGIPYLLTSNENREIAYSNYCNRMYEGHPYVPSLWIDELNRLYPFQSLYEMVPTALYSLRFMGLSKDEILVLQKRGHKFGGHSVSHDILSLLDDKELKNDFRQTSILLSQHIINEPIYAYPYGHPRDVTSVVIKVCENSIYHYAFMNEHVEFPTSYTRSRLNLGNGYNKYELDAKLSGFHQFLKKLV